MKSRKFYENYFSAYPDVVTLDQFRKMLGGLGEVQARKLMQQNHVKHFYIRGTYFFAALTSFQRPMLLTMSSALTMPITD